MTRTPTDTHHEPSVTSDAMSGAWGAFASVLVQRWVSVVVLVVGLVVLVGLSGSFHGEQNLKAAERLPSNAESKVYKDIVDDLGGTTDPRILFVIVRKDGEPLDRDDLDAANDLQQRIDDTDRGSIDESPPRAATSDDGLASLAQVSVAQGLTTKETRRIVDLVIDAAHTDLPDHLSAHATGGPAFGADFSRSFAGANARLLLITAAIVALLLLITYRSPILWIFPLLLIAFTDRAATQLAKPLAQSLGLLIDNAVTGLTSFLIFGAGTNYALLLISRYREELARYDDHREALRRAVSGAGPAIMASNITVVLCLFSLVVASLPGSRLIGVAAGGMLAFTVISMILILPALLSVLGRPVFWPLIPRPTTERRTNTGPWTWVARHVAKRKIIVLLLSVAALGGLTYGIHGTTLGLSSTEQFRNTPDSVTGLRVLGEHFSAGQATPTRVLVPATEATDLAGELTDTQGVKSVKADTRIGTWINLVVVLDAEPATDDAFASITRIRETLGDATTAATYTGGLDAEELDYRHAAERDLLVLTIVIIVVVFGILIALLRAFVAPLLLILTTSLGAAAAIGSGIWFSLNILNYPAIDATALLYSVVFLIALGVDYTIFLMVRVREEAEHDTTRGAVVRAVAHTGPVITSAGVVLAAVFVVLGILPLIVLAQIGSIVCIGIVLDTFVVRTLVVPSLVALFGNTVWWPGTPPGCTVDEDAVPHRKKRADPASGTDNPASVTNL